MGSRDSRTVNVALNTIWALASQMALVMLGIFSRKIFLDYLGIELLGVNSLFADVLVLFSFADLGFGAAIMFSMYKPIAEADDEKVSSLLLLYRTIYRYVIVVLIIMSLSFVPFLQYIKTGIPVGELTIYYIFFQITNIAEYVWAYRESYVIACQHERELTIANLLYGVIIRIVQIIGIVIFADFILYLTVGLFGVAIKKVAINYYIKRKYPVTCIYNAKELDKNERKEIMHKSLALVVTRIGNLVINQTDSLIVSYMINVTQWGLASNYLIIKKALFTISDKIYSGILPSMGNLVAENQNDRELQTFLKYDFLNAWMHTFFFIALACLSNLFIRLFFGQQATLSNVFVFVFFFASFIDGLRSPMSLMREASGLFEQDKWCITLAAIVNVVFSIPLAHIWGLVGVYIGTICAMTALHITRTLVLFNQGKYEMTALKYYYLLIKHIFVGVVLYMFTYCAVIWLDNVVQNIYVSFILSGIAVCFIPNIMWVAIYRNNNNCKWVVDFIKRQLLY